MISLQQVRNPSPLPLICIQICPILMDLMTSMDRIQSLPPNYGPREKIKEWYSRLYQKPATYELKEAESRQMLYDLESSYNTFFAKLKSS